MIEVFNKIKTFLVPLSASGSEEKVKILVDSPRKYESFSKDYLTYHLEEETLPTCHPREDFSEDWSYEERRKVFIRYMERHMEKLDSHDVFLAVGVLAGIKSFYTDLNPFFKTPKKQNKLLGVRFRIIFKYNREIRDDIKAILSPIILILHSLRPIKLHM